ncbi:esterase [Catellatospora sp. TT07R-123]|uniref:alpha/beta hydrolase-fold protein n=1 Tax=Catellatospora sp. TT07R-123 TaxID=2733863 RepID=UPI001B2AE488|nr:alpha/beta hydrolase-fold protein [Catellatospora sp. TT07R-123]GHJ50003.1 esterase [Catellatospora sp. TT07R-123]
MDRRRALLLGGAAAGAAVAGLGVWRAFADTPDDDGFELIPAVPLGDERVEQRDSATRGRQVDFYTAVPEGHGDGRGLPVCLVLHGASATAADFPRFGFGRFLTDAVRRGVPPFVLAGATGGRLRWEPSGADDPGRMAAEELPAWCGQRGFDVGRIALWGWSMGGYGVLRLAERFPGAHRAVAAFSPAVARGDAVFAGAAGLAGTPVSLWCGRQDGFYDAVRELEGRIPGAKAAYAEGGHTRRYWNTITPAAFDFLGRTLSPA